MMISTQKSAPDRGFIGRLLRRILVKESVAARLMLLPRGTGTVFMFHRFAPPGQTWGGTDPEELRQFLSFLQRTDHVFLRLDELIDRSLRGDVSLKRAVAFTVDDGHFDFAEFAAPIFREFHAPVTVFLTTGFLDGTTWCWWDQIEYLLRNASTGSVELRSTHYHASLNWSGSSILPTYQTLVALAKEVPDEARLRLISELSENVGVELPYSPPPDCAPMSWDSVRRLEAEGVSYGPHTVSHPILARVDESRAAAEIAESWQRVREQTSAAIPIFCYPNGDPDSFTARDVDLVRKAGVKASVTSIPGHVNETRPQTLDGLERFYIPRFSFSAHRHSNVAVVTGLAAVRSGFERYEKISS